MLPLSVNTKAPLPGTATSANLVLPGQAEPVDDQADQSGQQSSAYGMDLTLLLQQPYPADIADPLQTPLLPQSAAPDPTDTEVSQIVESTGLAELVATALPVSQSKVSPFAYSQSQSLHINSFVTNMAGASLSPPPSLAEITESDLVKPQISPQLQAFLVNSTKAGGDVANSNPGLLATQLQNVAPLPVQVTVTAIPAQQGLLSPLPGPSPTTEQRDQTLLASATRLQQPKVMPEVFTATSAGKISSPLAAAVFSQQQPIAFNSPQSAPGLALPFSTFPSGIEANPVVAQQSVVLSHSGQNTQHQWQSEPMPADPVRFGQRLLSLLSDKVDVQLGLGVNRAVIRLDPPALGSIDLSIQLEGEKLTVQLNSSNGQLKEAMQQGLELLRSNLQHKLGADTQIELRMGPDNQSQQQRERQPQSGDEIAANIAGVEQAENPDIALSATTGLVNQLV